jgi:hypothetical protein
MTHLTELLGRLHAGDDSARDELFATACAELHRPALSRLRDRNRNPTLDATSLVHETVQRDWEKARRKLAVALKSARVRRAARARWRRRRAQCG